MKNKSEVLQKFKEFHSFATDLCGNQIKGLRSDNGGEYFSNNFDEYLKQKGITRQLTVPNNSGQNGLAERMNHTIVESARSMMFHSNLSVNFWAEALNTAVYLKKMLWMESLLMNACLTENQMLLIFEYLVALLLFIFEQSSERNLIQSLD